MSELITDQEVIAFSWNMLARNAQDQVAFEKGLKAFRKQNPAGFQAVSAALKAAGMEVSGSVPSSKRSKNVASKKIQVLTDADLGQLITSNNIFQGIYLGRVDVDGEGRPLARPYHAFAAPEDLVKAPGQKGILNFNDTVREVAGLKNFHGFDGGYYENATAVYAGCNDGSIEGRWVVPPFELLNGRNANEIMVREERNLYDLRNEPSLIGTFDVNPLSSAACYWSCTEHRGSSSSVWAVRFSDGAGDLDNKDLFRRSCRLVRLVEVSHLAR